MSQLIGSPTLDAIAAMGYAFAKVILDGLTSKDKGDWIYLVIVAVSLTYAAVKPISESEAAYAFMRHILAVIVATILLYGGKNVDLTNVVGDKLVLGGTGTVTQGAAPLPTYLIDTFGTAVASTVKAIVAEPHDYLIPMLSNVVREATSNPANLVDKQVATNLSIWRFISAAAMRADSNLAQAIQSKNLLDRLQNPVFTNDTYSGDKATEEMKKVVEILDGASDSANLGVLVCNNITQVRSMADDYTGAAWVPDDPCDNGGGVSVAVISSATQDSIGDATSPGSYSDTITTEKAAKGAAIMTTLVADTSSAVAQTHFVKLSELYQALGGAALLSSAVHAAQEDSFKVMLGAQCLQKGDAVCKTSFAPAYNVLGDVVDGAGQESKPKVSFSWRNITDSIWKMIAGSLAFIVGAFMTLFSKLVAALMPFAIAMTRAIAIIISILGVYMLFIPGRSGDAIKWMIGPITFANLWSILYLFWWRIGEFFVDFGEQLYHDASRFSGDGISSAAVIQFTVAVGYTTLPALAWIIVFSAPERLMPRGTVSSMLSPATRAIGNFGQRYVSSKWSNKSGGSNNNSKSTASPPAANPPSSAPVRSNAPTPAGTVPKSTR